MTDPLKEKIAAELAAVRDRSLTYTDADDDLLVRQHSPLMSPLVWDLAHVGNYEELWVLREVGGITPLRPEIDDLYDAFKHPRTNRPALPLLGPAEARRYISGVRGRVLDVLDKIQLDDPDPLRAGGFVFGLILQHEHQHDETMLATLQLSKEPGLVRDGELPPARSLNLKGAASNLGRAAPEVHVPGGIFTMGTDTLPWAYDNERPAHRMYLPGYWIDRFPVSNAAYAEFIAAGGYDDPRWWMPKGWEWVETTGVHAPLFWQRDGDTWWRTRFGREEPVPMDEPVQHVSWYEADAYARWAGKRLPTEAEWEKACGGRTYPWGDGDPGLAHANLGHRAARPAPIGAFPEGASPYGAEQLIGDVWEWTDSWFLPYPGFRSFPYKEYSEVFFGETETYRVLRGGSWATHPTAVRTTFRNWDYPIRRQIFAGFRCARSED
ncbi:ergothioneine biosynthesis protein EgtB [Planotetraspora sp. A-T 1434]|uniref:ergothioneine biosynthesis protein EgtB n=1 Tax=Planotetraspora sp. A-T 1434 TaxID=2979219 RepID=UPI0021C05ECA|nr:ergothioneine biosynthesis protein EgtB [Planotetraspora sp. A-T 1434]MCT9930859.1 ergothioneine biosynthesis protein EgtB [Planotetraspora sp. A-T 1434]